MLDGAEHVSTFSTSREVTSCHRQKTEERVGTIKSLKIIMSVFAWLVVYLEYDDVVGCAMQCAVFYFFFSSSVVVVWYHIYHL